MSEFKGRHVIDSISFAEDMVTCKCGVTTTVSEDGFAVHRREVGAPKADPALGYEKTDAQRGEGWTSKAISGTKGQHYAKHAVSDSL
jgi:hypothetical protein